MNSDESINNEQQTDLDWLAFCYVADEMSEPEMVKFENRLSNDQSAREAVVRAMELSDLTLSAIAATHQRTETEYPVRKVVELDRAQPRRSSGRLVFAASIGLALLASGWAIYSNNETSGGGLASEAESLASVWAESSDLELETWIEDTTQTAEINETDWEFESGDEDSDVTPLVDEQTASWMLDALSSLDDLPEGDLE